MNNNDQPIVSVPTKDAKQTIIDMFLKEVKGKKADTALANINHDGKEGHWLETAMGRSHNRDNEPDILGYEMKNATSIKTTFGDWSADYYIFSKKSTFDIDRSDFLRIFGKANEKKNGRFSWSGEPCPKIGGYNKFGQILTVDNENNVSAIYCFSKDQRQNKEEIVPPELRQENLTLALWKSDTLRKRVENKFNKKGWFKCEKNGQGIYESIAFGDPITFDKWIECVKNGDVFLDSGMYEGNPRPYSEWRANNIFWEKMVTSRYN